MSTRAQVSLAGHTYYNDNIMAGLMDEALKDVDQKMAAARKSQKGTYVVQGELVILDDGEEKDTLRLSPDAKHLYGIFDKDTKYTLTRTK